MKRMIYIVSYPAVTAPTPQHPSMSIAGTGDSRPVTNCPKPDNGDGTLLEKCYGCSDCGEVNVHWLECSYKPSQKDKDELERRRKGISKVVKKPITPVGPEQANPTPQGVFTPPE